MNRNRRHISSGFSPTIPVSQMYDTVNTPRISFPTNGMEYSETYFYKSIASTNLNVNRLFIETVWEFSPSILFIGTPIKIVKKTNEHMVSIQLPINTTYSVRVKDVYHMTESGWSLPVTVNITEPKRTVQFYHCLDWCNTVFTSTTEGFYLSNIT